MALICVSGPQNIECFFFFNLVTGCSCIFLWASSTFYVLYSHFHCLKNMLCSLSILQSDLLMLCELHMAFQVVAYVSFELGSCCVVHAGLSPLSSCLNDTPCLAYALIFIAVSSAELMSYILINPIIFCHYFSLRKICLPLVIKVFSYVLNYIVLALVWIRDPQ